jgi:hypothetical protein
MKGRVRDYMNGAGQKSKTTITKMPMIHEEKALTTTAIPEGPTVKVKAPRKSNPWSLHVAEFRASNPTLSFKEVLKQAATTYKKRKE